MQVLSSRSNQTQRSTSFSKNNKRGLSLTCRTKCNSLPKPSRQFLQEQTLQSDRMNNNQTQISIKFKAENHSQQSSFFSAPQNCTSYLSERPTIQKPKITFRYSNNLNQQNQVGFRPKTFQAYNNEPLHPSQIRNRFLPCQQMRKIVVTKLIETKTESNMSHMTEKQQNINKIIIDSRRIDREIIQQDIYQSFQTTNQYSTLSHQITVNPPSIQSESQNNKKIQDIEKNKGFLQQNHSPYRMLISTAKKCQSKQLSPCLILQNQIVSTKILPQIGEFQINQVVFEENHQDSPSTSQVFDRVNQMQTLQLQNKKQETFEGKTQVSIKPQEQSEILKIYSKNNIQESLNLVNQKLIQKSPQKISLFKNPQSSPKKIKKNLSNKILSDIENRPPETHGNSAISGRRNVKRFKQIEKRLQEIITICGKNL